MERSIKRYSFSFFSLSLSLSLSLFSRNLNPRELFLHNSLRRYDRVNLARFKTKEIYFLYIKYYFTNEKKNISYFYSHVIWLKLAHFFSKKFCIIIRIRIKIRLKFPFVFFLFFNLLSKLFQKIFNFTVHILSKNTISNSSRKQRYHLRELNSFRSNEMNLIKSPTNLSINRSIVKTLEFNFTLKREMSWSTFGQAGGATRDPS